jgi:uncharacterized membrane protein
MAGNRKPSLDLLLVAGLVLLTDAFMLVPALSGSFLRTYLGVLLVLLLPGYALTSAIFPAKKDLDGIERAAISFGLSIAVVPTVGLGLNYTIWGIREIPVLIVLSVFTFLMCAVAYYRRSLLSETEVFEVSFKDLFFGTNSDIFKNSESETGKILAAGLIICIVASVGSLAYIIENPKKGEKFTEFYILGSDKKAENYTTEFLSGEKGTVTVGIINHEYRTVDYTMDVRLENHSLSLPENQRKISLENNMSWEEPVTFIPPLEGKNMKLEFLLFNETDKTTPYRDLHLWINVTRGA